MYILICLQIVLEYHYQQWDIYGNHKHPLLLVDIVVIIPEFLVQFANTPAMLRLKQVGMHCGCEYTCFPIFKHLECYSRYDHSIGVAMIIYHFTKDIKQSLAGLFHDIATPAFSHVIDFLNNDHLTQESTEDGTKEIIVNCLNCFHICIIKIYHIIQCIF